LLFCLHLWQLHSVQMSTPWSVGFLDWSLAMISNSQKTCRGKYFTWLAAFAVVLWAGGYAHLWAQTNTEDEATETLNKLQIQIQDVAEPNVPMPEVYKSPPEIVEQTVGGKSEWKLFYFCRYQSSDELKKIIHEQFATKLFDQKGKETQIPDYTISSNPATNQLIARCPAREDAESVLETLNQVDVPPIQVKIDCLISEIYADFTFDRETTIAIENLFGENITMKPGGTAFGADVQQLISDDEYLPAFPGASLRELIRSRMGLKIGYSSTAHEFTALVDLLESRGFLKILMNPTLEIVNGKTAIVQSSQHVPLQKVTKTIPGVGATSVVLTETEYVDVNDSLQITPHVFADGYIGLETSIVLGAKNTPDGVKQVPILTKKQINSKENRIRPGESLIIGGIRKTEKFGVARGVPILKDLPLIGFLFSGVDTEQRAVETVFILTPTISTNGRPREEIMAEIRRKHESTPSEKGLADLILDPFGIKAGQHAQEQNTMEAEQVRHEADVEKADAQTAVRQADERVRKAEEELQRTKIEAEKTKAAAEKKSAEADEKTRAAEQAMTAADKATADAKKAQEQADQNKAENDEKISSEKPAAVEARKPQEESEDVKNENTKDDSEA
jgi:flagellar biosynthesis GTPase FlhF